MPCTLVTVAAIEGSAPREAGTKMLVHLDGMAGSVGGGHLEFKALAEAKSLLQTAAPQAALIDFALGPQPRPMLRRTSYAALRAADLRCPPLADGVAAAFQ